jgi:hypothetical protein
MAARSSPAMSLPMRLQNHMRSWLQTPNQQEYSSRENGQSIEGTEGERSQGDHPLGSKTRPTAAGKIVPFASRFGLSESRYSC